MKTTALILFVTFLLMEFAGLFVFDNRYTWDQRYLWFSIGSVANDYADPGSKQLAFWRYKENTQVRSAALYMDYAGVHISYDYTFKTNRLGFTDTGEFGSEVDYLVLGDSFLDGQGGGPWLTKENLKKDSELSKVSLLQAGVPGYGMQGFELLLKYHERFVDIKNLIFVAISNDFRRGRPWTWDEQGDCVQKGICAETKWYGWHFIPRDISKEGLIKKSLERQAKRERSVVKELSKYSFSYRTYEVFKNEITKSAAGEAPVLDEKPFLDNYEAFKRMKDSYPNLRVLMVPQRDEMGLLGKENLDSKRVKKFLQEQGTVFEVCPLSSDDFMKYDGHPNAQGYQKVFKCLKKMIVSK